MMYKTGLLLTVLCASQFVPSAAEAAIFKCVGSDGEVSYNQTPCPVQEQTAKVMSSGSSGKDSYDCRIANNFARRTAVGMRNGMSSGDVFASYGGIDAIPRTAIGVINYVYTHKENYDTTPQRIAALSAARCSAGSYGPVACEDFPYGFISELGGCDDASKAKMKPNAPAAAATHNMPATNTNGTTQAMGVRTAADSGVGSEACKRDVQSQLTALFSQMRSGQSAGAQGQLQQRKKDLQSQLSDC